MIKILDSEKDNLVALEISGKITKEGVQKMRPPIQNVLDKNKKVDFYIEVHDFEGYDLEGFWADLKLDATYISNYGKMAVVGEKKWQEWAAKTSDFLISSDVKYFDIEEKRTAQQWIGM